MGEKLTLEEVQYRINCLITYLEVKLKERDWHGVSDAANDLRVLETKYEMLKNE
jgi:hypothetical protein